MKAIPTFTGRIVDLENPDPSMIDIRDIAHGLAGLNRFSCQTPLRYTVAQHSVMMSRVCVENPLWALLHDASEAYLHDLSSPLKRLSGMDTYRKLEAKWMLAIRRKFGLMGTEPASIRVADIRMAATEWNSLGTVHLPWLEDVRPYPWKLSPWSPEDSEKLFLRKYNMLTDKV